MYLKTSEGGIMQDTCNIYEALAEARQGHGNVYAQQADGTWVRIYKAKQEGFVLRVQGLSIGKWFTPQQWEVRL
jgi:hypothetical protein